MRNPSIIVFGLFACGCSGSSLPGGGNHDGSSGGHLDLAVAKGSLDMTTSTSLDLTMPPPDLTAPPDLTMIADLTMPTGDLAIAPPQSDAGVPCGGNLICSGGEFCCASFANMMATTMCAASCPDGGVTIACGGPSDCGGNPCCATVTGGAPSDIVCTNDPNACAPTIDINTQSGMDRLCTMDSDCGNGMPGINTGIGFNLPLNQCCTLINNGLSTRVCLNSTALMLAGMFGIPITGHCP
jgi:hypothetical protein